MNMIRSFNGLAPRRLLDFCDELGFLVYREIISKSAWMGQDVPAEVVAGMIDTSCGYNSGLSVAVYRLGEGRLTLNTLRIRENLGKDSVAERLLRNMLRYGAHNVEGPLADLPPDFDAQLEAIGYRD